MREYAKLGPTFWTGETGKALRRRGSKALLAAAYLISSPHSNMLGLYYQPILYMAHETGMGIDGASEGLAACIECGFCSYDEATEMVWVHEMAAWQIADSLSSGDKRCKGIQKDYEALPENPFLGAWFDRYALPFHLSRRRGDGDLLKWQTKGHTKPHRSQEQEQEQEQEQDSPLRGETPPQGPSSPELLKPDQPPESVGKGNGLPGPAIERPEGVDATAWADWLAVRKAKRAGPITATAWSGMVREAAKAGITPDAAVRACCEYGWQGFNAAWEAKRSGNGTSPPTRPKETPWERSKRERMHEITGGTVSRKPPTETKEIVDVDVPSRAIAH
jgi:hypothetical protein